MPAPLSVVEAVKAAIVASAHLVAYEHVSAAAAACARLGSLTSGRWRSAARDLDRLEEDLETAFASAADAVVSRADQLGVPADALWTAGDSAGTLDLLREAALDELDELSPASKILQGEVLFGASFLEDPDLPDRGTTLLFGWPEPLAPASWPWQANWIAGDPQTNGDSTLNDELDLYEAGEMEGDEALLTGITAELGVTQQDARTALRAAALALTRASLLASTDDDEDDGEEEED